MDDHSTHPADNHRTAPPFIHQGEIAFRYDSVEIL